MIPSERYVHLMWEVPEGTKDLIERYVDESYNQDITLEELECATWREVIIALIKFEHDGTHADRHEALISDYKLYRDAA